MATVMLTDVLSSSSFSAKLLALSFLVWLSWLLISTIISYRRLRHIPGPPLAAITNLWWIRAAVSERAHIILGDVCSRYGSIARIAPDTVVTNDLDLLRKINANKSTKYRRGDWYKAFKLDFERENLFTERDEEKHARMRQKLAPGYSGRDNPALESTIDEVMMSTVHLINRKYISVKSNLKPLDFAGLMQRLTLDVITYLSLGEAFGFVQDDSDKFGYIKSMEDTFPLINFISAVPFLSDITTMPAVQKLLIPKVTDNVGIGKVKAIAQGIIAKRFSGEKSDKHDMVKSFMKQGMTTEEIADESLMLLLAGSDTAATTLRTGFLSIISNARIYRTLCAEILSFCEKSSLPVQQVISNASSLKLPYLQACIKEALRHHPPGTGLLPRVVGPEGDFHKGIYLPPGTKVTQCAWNAHRRNTEVYGADADTYRPERWLEASPEKLAKMEEASYLIFGYGRFRCMGENIAKFELSKVWFELLRRFEWALVDAQNPLEKNANYGLFYQKGMWVRVEERVDVD